MSKYLCLQRGLPGDAQNAEKPSPADLHRRCGRDELAARHREVALQSAPSAAVKEVLRRRLAVHTVDLRPLTKA